MCNLRNCVFISLLIHIIVLFFLNYAYNFKPNNYQKVEKLIVEFDGKIAEKQVEEKVVSKKEESAEAKEEVKEKIEEKKSQEQVEEKKQKKEVEKKKIIEDDKAIKKLEKEAEIKKKTEETAALKQSQKQEKKEKANEEKEEKKQQTVEHDKTDIDELRRYLAKLKKSLQANLVYPKELKELGYIGNPEIQFSINSDGSVDKSSISIKRSSGYEILDTNAINTVLNSSPFEKPQKSMTISVEVAFFSK